eukprot:gnl/TRDRNA2_/TRDRNA2_85945_c1_seq2.p1 gnl/TRDRNA2_/TRDRNA2_85945_c1~~gnl/TRDRNA2_/TRDRNA2_85945_c1_seq2.p1  ORF type:complete len:127 (-),score=10.40 gnl/TRDRNA2_/TRDRNA2_85945_c1_seq2:182-562(-)
MAGYWGCVFADGKERCVRWRPDTLRVGSRVGLLITGADKQRDLVVFVDDVPVVRAEGILTESANDSEALYPVVDVFAATLSVWMPMRARVPNKPWLVDVSTLSPPGSPASVSRSVCSVKSTPLVHR